MAQFDIKDALDDMTNGQVALDIVEGLQNENGEDTYYDYKHEEKGLTIVIDRQTFEPADKKVVEALVNNVSFNSKEREKAEALLAEFVNRTGRYSKIKEKEEREAEKERLKLEKQREKEEKERLKQQEKAEREHQKKVEREQREELKQLIKELDGSALEQLVQQARTLASVNEKSEAEETIVVVDLEEMDIENQEKVTV